VRNAADRERIALLFDLQAPYCQRLGSPLYRALLERIAADVRAGGQTAEVLADHFDDPPRSMLPLRLLGAVHRLVLAGEAPELARHYPSAGGAAGSDEEVWSAFLAVVERLEDRVRSEVRAPVQTNEVGRCMGLLGGFLTVACRTGLPLRILEVGASAGLNLGFDRYRYSIGDSAWGDDGSPVRFADFLAEGALPLDVHATVVERLGCDAAPLDPRSERDRLLLRSFVWPDQLWRFEPLTAALEMTAEQPAQVERADAVEWARAQLSEPRPGTATVLFHSLVLMYLGEEAQEEFIATIAAAGARASTDAPLTWMRMELGGDEADVYLTTWPEGEERRIARAGYHGRPVRWFGGQ
jgi:hypothetical protein